MMGPVMGHTILEMDEPEHHAHRGARAAGVQPQGDGAWEAELVGAVVDELIDAFVDARAAPTSCASSPSRSRCT